MHQASATKSAASELIEMKREEMGLDSRYEEAKEAGYVIALCDSDVDVSFICSSSPFGSSIQVKIYDFSDDGDFLR